MNWKTPPTNIFWVPVPYNPEFSLMSLLKFRRNKEEKPEQMELTDPETNQPYKAEIIDYLGPYPATLLPDHISAECTDKKDMTGQILAAILRKKLPEFRDTEKIVFYQLAKINV